MSSTFRQAPCWDFSVSGSGQTRWKPVFARRASGLRTVVPDLRRRPQGPDRQHAEILRDPVECNRVRRGVVVAPHPVSLRATSIHSIAVMSNTDRLKSRLLKEAVEENVATMDGLLPKPLRRHRRLAALWGPRLAAMLLFLALVGGLRFMSIGTAVAQSSAVRQHAVADSAPVAAMSDASTPTFSKPQRLSPSALALSVRRVVIDAGHGGTSLGTAGAQGLLEKD